MKKEKAGIIAGRNDATVFDQEKPRLQKPTDYSSASAPRVRVLVRGDPLLTYCVSIGSPIRINIPPICPGIQAVELCGISGDRPWRHPRSLSSGLCLGLSRRLGDYVVAAKISAIVVMVSLDEKSIVI